MQVKAGELAFSVFVYNGVAFLAIGFLIMRRYLIVWGKAELGGPRHTKIMTSLFLVALWFFYVGLSVLNSSDTKLFTIELFKSK
jgi:solute carrier family 8 (sodium/calcium exchanger)